MLIDIKGVNKRFKSGVMAVYDLNIEIDKGEFVFIMGHSGCGKSTLMKMLYREERPTKGSILIGGVNVAKLRDGKVHKLRKKEGVVFQDFRLLPKLTVYENVAFALEIFGAKKNDIKDSVLKVLDLVGLKNKAKRYPDELSGGEQQRIAIARAIINKPKLLLCDEPTGNLDAGISLEILRVLEKINELGTTVIMITHDKELVKHSKGRIIELKDGSVISDSKEGGIK